MIDPEPTADKVLFPGTEVKIPNFGAVKVFPCGIVQLQKYTGAIGETVALLLSVKMKKDVDFKLQMMASLVPQLMTGQLLSLVLECTKVLEPVGVKPERIPIWGLAPLIEAWLTENFGGERLDPWLAVGEKLISQLAKRNVAISEIASRLSSQAATSSGTSSTAETKDTPTPAGASAK